MALWIVTNQWMGYLHEGVVVEADNNGQAIDKAKEALTAEWTSKLDEIKPEFIRKEAQAHLDSYSRPDMRWTVIPIELPYVGEF